MKIKSIRYLDIMELLNEKIKEISSEIKEIAKENEDARLLMTIPGIDYYSAMLILAEIGDVRRFADSHKLCAYAGLVPSTYQSGDKIYHGHIIKGIAARREKKIAIVSTASKMLRVIYQISRNFCGMNHDL